MDIMKYFSGMLDYNPEVEWMDEQQKFDANGMPIPVGTHTLFQPEAVPRMMTPPSNFSHLTDEQVHEAAEVAEAWKKELQHLMSGGGMLNSKKEPKKDTGGRNKAVKRVPNLKTSEKPGWIMAEGTNWWSVNEKDPYWQTKQGHDEAVALYGFKPGWVSNPVEQENTFASLEPTVMASNLKKYF
jgi:hypothetical protein